MRPKRGVVTVKLFKSPPPYWLMVSVLIAINILVAVVLWGLSPGAPTR
jgi:hypothetical protein